MNARIPTKSRMQEMYDELKAEFQKKLEEAVDKEHSNAINLCILTRLMADIDSGLAESTVMKTTKRWQSYIDSVHSGNVSLEEIKTTLEEEHGMKFEWMNAK